MTRDDGVAVAGPIEDRFVVEILDAGGERGDLIEAVARTRGEIPSDSLRPTSATVSQLCEIIEAADAVLRNPLEWEAEAP